MTQIILETIKPVVIEKLKNLAQKHQRTLEAEITAILEDVFLCDIVKFELYYGAYNPIRFS